MRRLLPLILLLPACNSAPPRSCPTAAPITSYTDVLAKNDPTVPVLDVQLCEALAAKMGRPGAPPPGRKPFDVLVLSGGGSYGAYSAGLLCGWSELGTRPAFDVVTGVSTGAIVATLAFLGPEYDPALRHFYTTVTDKDIYTKKFELEGLLTDSLADSKPLFKLISAVVDEKLLARVAAEHAKGRRLYVGTTHLDSRRLVQWDMGAIASRGSPHDLDLFRRVLLASAAIPGFFPPVPLPVTVDGKVSEELHVDGGVTASLFFVPPRVPAADRAGLGDQPLAGSNLYIVVAGKLYAEPACVERTFVKIATDSIAALLYAQTRGDLFQLFALCLATKMNYYLTAVPADVPAPAESTSFDPAEMTKLFAAGKKAATTGGMWRSTPPGLEPGELVPVRSGTWFATTPTGAKKEGAAVPVGETVVPAGGK
jgi:Patatin-like phospholipase